MNKSAIEEAKRRSQPAPVQPGGLDWPRWEDISLDDALTAIEVQMWDGALKFSLGLTSDGKGMWGRAAAPKWSSRKPIAGKSAIAFAGGLEHLLRKLAQLAESPDEGVWKDDPYAR
jgi:hypothetical protein